MSPFKQDDDDKAAGLYCTCDPRPSKASHDAASDRFSSDGEASDYSKVDYLGPNPDRCPNCGLPLK